MIILHYKGYFYAANKLQKAWINCGCKDKIPMLQNLYSINISELPRIHHNSKCLVSNQKLGI